MSDTDPQLMMAYSTDNGHTWSAEQWKSIGMNGEYQTRVDYRGLGSGYNYTFKLRFTDPFGFSIIEGFGDVEVIE